MSVHVSIGLDWKGQNTQVLASYLYHTKSWQDGVQFSAVEAPNSSASLGQGETQKESSSSLYSLQADQLDFLGQNQAELFWQDTS